MVGSSFKDLGRSRWLLAPLLLLIGLLVLLAGSHARKDETPPLATPSSAVEPAVATAPSAPSAPTNSAATLVVSVRTHDGAIPLLSARITVARIHSTAPPQIASTQAGSVQFDGLKPGAYGVRLEHPEFATHHQELELVPGRLELELELVQGGSVAGRVFDARGLAVAGANISAAPAGSVERGRETQSGEDGSFSLLGLPLGELVLRVVASPHRPNSMDVHFRRHGEHRELVVHLSSGQVISGRVLAPDGRPIAGANVGSSDSGSPFVTTQEAGTFELAGLGYEPVQVFATAPGFAPARHRSVIPGTQKLDLVLSEPARVHGRLELPRAAEHVTVSVCHFDDFFKREICVQRRLYRQPATSYELDELPSGNYELVAEIPGWKALRQPVQLEPGQTASGPTLSWAFPR